MKNHVRNPLLSAALLLLACKEASGPPAPLPSPPPAAAAAPAADGVQEVLVTAKGFEPARVEATAGRPLVLRFTRKVAETCADAVEVQGDPVRHILPLGKPVDVKVTPPTSGELAFACPMKMVHGAVVVLQR